MGKHYRQLDLDERIEFSRLHEAGGAPTEIVGATAAHHLAIAGDRPSVGTVPAGRVHGGIMAGGHPGAHRIGATDDTSRVRVHRHGPSQHEAVDHAGGLGGASFAQRLSVDSGRCGLLS